MKQRRWWERMILQSLAGAVAEERANPDFEWGLIRETPEDDLATARRFEQKIITADGSPESLESYREKSLEQTRDLLDRHWPAVAAIAAALVQHRELREHHLRSVIRAAL